MTTKPSNSSSDQSNQKKAQKAPGLLKTILSSVAMLVGIQSRKNHEEDFEAGIWHLVLVCFICALIFFFGIYTIVQIIMANID